MYHEIEDEEARRARRRQLIEQGKRRNRRRRLVYALIRAFGPYVAGAFALILVIVLGVKLLQHPDEKGKAPKEGQNTTQAQAATGQKGSAKEAGTNPEAGANSKTGTSSAPGANTVIGPNAVTGSNGQAEKTVVNGRGEGKPEKTYMAQTTAETKQLGADINSGYAIMVDLESGNILAEKGAMTRIDPASMTKVLTVLVAAEHVKDLDDTFTITLDITDYSYVNDCSSVGFAENEVVTVRDLFYGTILPSGGDAAAALAVYVAGSREAFVDMMNEKLYELGLADTAHMTNCVGLYNEEHYCTLYDMAMILEAAIDNDLCREVLSAHTYTTSATAQHPEGITISNWFLRRIEDKDTGGEVICGKTGYVVQSGNCAASYGMDAGGKEFICVTAHASSAWKCIYDHVAIYKEFASSPSGVASASSEGAKSSS